MNIEMITTCRICGRQWTPDHSDYVAGRWRTCPDCRGHPTSNHTNEPPQRRSEAGNGSQGHIEEIDQKREGEAA